MLKYPTTPTIFFDEEEAEYTKRARMIEVANESGIPVISMDVPSGLDPTTGEDYGPCVRATKTLTLALPKRGLMVETSRKYVGELYVADIGILPELYSEMGLKVGAIFSAGSVLRIF